MFNKHVYVFTVVVIIIMTTYPTVTHKCFTMHCKIIIITYTSRFLPPLWTTLFNLLIYWMQCNCKLMVSRKVGRQTGKRFSPATGVEVESLITVHLVSMVLDPLHAL